MHTVVIGGGITGLACAHYLLKDRSATDMECTVVEASDRLGGKIRTTYRDDFVIEAGPDSFVTNSTAALDLAKELDLQDHLVRAPRGNTVYVVKDRRLVPLPDGMRLIVPTKTGPFLRSRLLSPGGRFRALLEPLVPSRRSTAGRDYQDESIADFTRRRFGREMLDLVAEPMMAGIHLGDPARLSMDATFSRFAELEKNQGSLRRAMRPSRRQRPGGSEYAAGITFTTFRNGMSQLVNALTMVSRADIRLKTVATGVEDRAQGHGYQVHLQRNDDGSREFLSADWVVLAVSATAAADVLSDRYHNLASLLRSFRVVSSATVNLGFHRAADVPVPDGSGLVVPRREGLHIRGVSFSSRKFPGRAPKGSLLVRAFLGEPAVVDEDSGVLSRTDAALADLVVRELGWLLKAEIHPDFTEVFRYPAGTPQYEVGHLDRVHAVETASPPGLFLVGASYRGVGIPSCVEDGRTVARTILERGGEKMAADTSL